MNLWKGWGYSPRETHKGVVVLCERQSELVIVICSRAKKGTEWHSKLSLAQSGTNGVRKRRCKEGFSFRRALIQDNTHTKDKEETLPSEIDYLWTDRSQRTEPARPGGGPTIGGSKVWR